MIDIWSYISLFIERDKDKCNLLMTSQELTHCKVFFNETINLTSISKSRWFHQYTNVLTNELIELPKNLKILNFADRFNEPINNYVPYGVVYLSFGYMFNQSLYECIPSSVTHLEFRNKKISFITHHSHFTYPLRESVPLSVKNLIIESNMIGCNDINKLTNITHMTIDFYNWCDDRDLIPPSVSHLTLGNYNGIHEIPTSVTHLTLKQYNVPSLKHFIPTSVKNIYFHDINKQFQRKAINDDLKDLNIKIEFL